MDARARNRQSAPRGRRRGRARLAGARARVHRPIQPLAVHALGPRSGTLVLARDGVGYRSDGGRACRGRHRKAGRSRGTASSDHRGSVDRAGGFRGRTQRNRFPGGRRAGGVRSRGEERSRRKRLHRGGRGRSARRFAVRSFVRRSRTRRSCARCRACRAG